VRDGKKILMRHASRSQGMVVEQELSEFLKQIGWLVSLWCGRSRSRDALQLVAKMMRRGGM